ncbi:4Fe-4S binding protein [candidate division CSSED10-310 bacterium]|uniref:4Fe-4S binding protein n=1 Tax=candidate division CSSED10-310 bacterium TaxID=2855610 RepID=A0ABV6YRK7_UNCC1
MGHLRNIKELYRSLNTHISHHQTQLPDTPAAHQILKVLFSPEEAELALKLPFKPVKLKTLARRLQESPEVLHQKLDKMADRGLVFDFLREETGEYYYILAPPIVGFLEFSFMRVRGDIPQKELANLLYESFHKDKQFVAGLFGGQTNIGRTLVHESTLPEDYSDILSYEQATALIEESGGGAVSLCYCRHSASHVDQGCNNPQEICTSLYEGADFVIRHGFGRHVEQQELLDILAQARELGLVQIADNVQNKPTYICHCCGCCCGQLTAINKWGISNAVHTSNFIAAVDEAACAGCGRCARRCPIGAIKLESKMPYTPVRHDLLARIDEEICLGCGVCVPACKKDALSMAPRPKRVLTPETTLERVLRMNLENGTIQYLLFNDPTNQNHQWLNRFLNVIFKLPPVKWVLLNESLQSRYINHLMKGARKTVPDGMKDVIAPRRSQP